MTEQDFEKMAEEERVSHYVENRGNMPVVTVEALEGEPVYTAKCRLYIARHGSQVAPPAANPTKVVWFAGKMFSVQTATEAPFEASYKYYGGFLAQAQIHFEDGYVALAHVYVPMPPKPSQSLTHPDAAEAVSVGK